jgi:hypothetical protein
MHARACSCTDGTCLWCVVCVFWFACLPLLSAGCRDARPCTRRSWLCGRCAVRCRCCCSSMQQRDGRSSATAAAALPTGARRPRHGTALVVRRLRGGEWCVCICVCCGRVQLWCCRGRQARGCCYNQLQTRTVRHMQSACCPPGLQSHAHTDWTGLRAPARTHTRTHTHTRARAHTHTQRARAWGRAASVRRHARHVAALCSARTVCSRGDAQRPAPNLGRMHAQQDGCMLSRTDACSAARHTRPTARKAQRASDGSRRAAARRGHHTTQQGCVRSTRRCAWWRALPAVTAGTNSHAAPCGARTRVASLARGTHACKARHHVGAVGPHLRARRRTSTACQAETHHPAARHHGMMSSAVCGHVCSPQHGRAPCTPRRHPPPPPVGPASCCLQRPKRVRAARSLQVGSQSAQQQQAQQNSAAHLRDSQPTPQQLGSTACCCYARARPTVTHNQAAQLYQTRTRQCAAAALAPPLTTSSVHACARHAHMQSVSASGQGVGGHCSAS